MSWNIGEVLESVENIVSADHPALIHGDRTITWGELKQRSDNLASAILSRGIEPGDKIAFYMRNCPEYSETLVAAFKARLVHVNVNYRYVENELHYIIDNSDAAVVVFSEEFRDRVDAIRQDLPKVKLWIQVGKEADSTDETRASYNTLVSEPLSTPIPRDKSPDDLLFIYTGGTTGMPKGVMWRQADLWEAFGGGAMPIKGIGRAADMAEFRENLTKAGPGGRMIPAPPLMHGTGLISAISTLTQGGTVITLEELSFDPTELCSTIEKHKVMVLIIVGDAFARPLVQELDANGDQYDISSLKVITSSGVMFSPELKLRLIEHNENLIIGDSFSSSEALGFGTSVTTKAGTSEVAKFAIGERCKVFTEDHHEVAPGSDVPGFIARCGPIPQGYYKDEVKTAKTFPVINGVRYSIPGDWCKVAEDGTLQLLGRGSVCINTAGEKVYPEEVEEILKEHATVDDALVVGLPDDKWGQSVTGVVQLATGKELDEEELKRFVRTKLAGYKVPKKIIKMANLGRAPNGKADYKGVTAFAQQELA